jgi:hypothetical protein
MSINNDLLANLEGVVKAATMEDEELVSRKGRGGGGL